MQKFQFKILQYRKQLTKVYLARSCDPLM